MGKQGQGEGGERGYLSGVEDVPTVAPKVAGTHVMGVGEVAHDGESPRNVAEVSGW